MTKAEIFSFLLKMEAMAFFVAMAEGSVGWAWEFGTMVLVGFGVRALGMFTIQGDIKP